MWPRSEVLGPKFFLRPLCYFFLDAHDGWQDTKSEFALTIGSLLASGLKQVWKVQTLNFFLPIGNALTKYYV